MQSENTRAATIIGGSYIEVCDLYDGKPQLKGSGIRALEVFLELGWNGLLSFYSCVGKNRRLVESLYHRENVKLMLTDSMDVTFNYDHPFRMTSVYPRPDVIFVNKKRIEAGDDNVLVFGMLDADFRVKAKKAVFDPQTTVMMPSFRGSGSEAEELIFVLNANEARALAGCEDEKGQRDIIFEKEKCHALVIKQGAKGAMLFRSKDDDGFRIPVYMTPKVNSIGSGDVFTATFAYTWFNGALLEEAAMTASKAVACFVVPHCVEGLKGALANFKYQALEYRRKGQVYLAGPFFSYSQRWLIGQFYRALLGEGVKVFSPLHDVGIGSAEEVTEPDIEGLNASDVVLAVVDGLDSGTLFEIGYAVAKGKKVVAYVQNESEKALQMLEGTHCDIENDFTTAIYKTSWYAAQ